MKVSEVLLDEMERAYRIVCSLDATIEDHPEPAPVWLEGARDAAVFAWARLEDAVNAARAEKGGAE